MNSLSPRFAGFYTQVADKWYFLQGCGTTNPAFIRKEYNASTAKQALLVSSPDVFVDTGLIRSKGKVTNQPVVLTDTESKRFSAADHQGKKNLLNQWFEGLYYFNDVQIKPAQSLDELLK